MKMKALQPKEFKTAIDKDLLKVNRWNDTVDTDLFNSVVLNKDTPLYTQGLPVYDTKTITINDTAYALTVLYNPYMVASVGCMIAICCYNCFNQVVVFVDDRFMSLSEDAKTFTINHELGHLYHRHYSMIATTRTLDNEHAADSYACTKSNSNTAIKALKEIKSLLKGFKYLKSRKELNLRIKALS